LSFTEAVYIYQRAASCRPMGEISLRPRYRYCAKYGLEHRSEKNVMISRSIRFICGFVPPANCLNHFIVGPKSTATQALARDPGAPSELLLPDTALWAHFNEPVSKRIHLLFRSQVKSILYVRQMYLVKNVEV
jgi:hypothetical protein